MAEQHSIQTGKTAITTTRSLGYTRHDKKNPNNFFFLSCRHADREAEPKDYDVCNSDERNLLKATYNRIGNITDGVRRSL